MQRKNGRKGAKFCRRRCRFCREDFAGEVCLDFCGGFCWGFARILRRARMRCKPGKKQVGAAGKFNSRAPQACPAAAFAAPNPGMPYLRRMREAKWPDSEKLLGNFWPLSRNDFLKLRRQPGKSKLAPPGSSIPGRHRLAPPPLSRRQTQACHICAAREKQIGRIQRRS